MWRLLNSRKFAVYLLATMTAMLVLSSFLPSYITLGDKGWYALKEKRPYVFWFASHLSTPFLVTNPFFLAISLFLFLSTTACTVTRLNHWFKSRESEFSKEKSFSFIQERTAPSGMDGIQSKIEGLLGKGKWKVSVEESQDNRVISGQKGTSGFWGSVVFHAGLIICFFAGPVSVATTFRGELIIPEDVETPLRTSFESYEGKDTSTLPDVQVSVHGFRAKYYEGRFKYDFGGTLTIHDDSESTDIPFAVNKPVNYQGYQFALQEYGFSPRIVIEKEGRTAFDYYLNLRHREGDSFEIEGEGLKMLVKFFPDFFQEGDKLGSKSMIPENPVTMIKLYRQDNREVSRGLLKPGDVQFFEGYEIGVPDYKYWVNMVVVRESGIKVVIIGFVVGVAGLLVRFLSNERRLEFALSRREELTVITVKGYSRYYPAFLEREVLRMARMIGEGQDDAF